MFSPISHVFSRLFSSICFEKTQYLFKENEKLADLFEKNSKISNVFTACAYFIRVTHEVTNSAAQQAATN